MWRTTSYTAAMPAVSVQTARATLLGYANHTTPDSSIVAFGDNIVAKVSRTVPELVENRDLRERLTAQLVIEADNFRNTRDAVELDMPIEPMWSQMLKEPAFQMSVWSSQRMSYVAFYNAYEAFLVNCAKHILGVTKLRATDKEFKDALRTGLGKDVFQPCWAHAELNNSRLVRHALSHADGRETDDLKKQRHGIMLIEGVLQILPEDNHKMLARLRSGVDALVTLAAAHPKFATPAK